MAERAVQTFKQAIVRIQGDTIQERLSKFLFNYRISPHTTTGIPPSEMLMGRRLRSRLDLLYPDISTKVEIQQEKQKKSHDTKKPLRSFKIGDFVYAQNFNGIPKWIAGSVVSVSGPLSYVIALPDGTQWRRHVDNLRGRENPIAASTPPPLQPRDSSLTTESNGSSSVEPLDSSFPDVPNPAAPIPPAPIALIAPIEPPAQPTSSVRRSARNRQPPDRFNK